MSERVGFDIATDRSISRDDLEGVAAWRDVYDFLYEGVWDPRALGEDFAGWHSVYDGTPIPVPQMHEWRDATVDRILLHRPRCVLEIGVGDGHVLSRVAGHCDRYVGCDFSEVAIGALRQQLRSHPALDRKVELRVCAAHEIDGRDDGGFDTVIINSVVQYFPSERYLRTVLDVAVGLLAPAGVIYIGDIRNARSQPCLATAVALSDGAASRTPAALQAEVADSIARERELFVDPAFFTRYAAAQPDITAVDVRLRRGSAHNELTRHRYDVLLHDRQAAVAQMGDAPILRWPGAPQTLAPHLRTSQSDRLRVVGVPNARLYGEALASAALNRALRGVGDVAEARRALSSAVPAGLPDPEDFHRIGAAAGFEVAVTWSSDRFDELDVVFVAPGAVANRGWAGVFFAAGSAP